MRCVRETAVAVLCAALVVSLSACVQSNRSSGAGDGQTLVFAAAGAPKNFDPIWNDDGESFRAMRQMFDTLISHKPGTAELEPGLAESWQSSPDGKAITFKLRRGVKFHDGTPFDAAAVCFNLDRWYTMSGAAAQSQMIYYADVFEGFAKNESSAVGKPVYRGCRATDPSTAVMTLNRSKGAFPAAMTLPSFAISSPTALKKYDADKVTQSGDSFSFNEYATLHPTGTGPYEFVKFDRGAGTIEMVRNDAYWGGQAKIKRLIFKVIPDENARKQELRAGTIDGYDLPSPADYASLRKDGFTLGLRPAFNVLYLGINEKHQPKLRDLRVRQAIAYAINREALVKTRLPEGATVATQFIPDTVAGYAKDLRPYPYDPAKARALLKAAGATNLTLKFYYPTEVSRPYMPSPKDLFTVIAADLTAAGIGIEPVARPWNGGYKDDVQTLGKQDLHLLGWTGDYNDAGNFVGSFFGRAKPEFGFDDARLFRELAAADGEPDAALRARLYQQVNRDIMTEYLPAIPIAHSPPGIVVRNNIHGLIPSPLTDERFETVTKD
jgi:peptide/nickel transport system substrate-binding protein